MIESVGLDIGETAFKAVRYRRSLTGQEQVEYFYQTLPFLRETEADQAVRAKLLKRFLEMHHLHRAHVVTALPAGYLSLRRLALPFRDQAQMAQVVPFEVENLLPMDLEDVAVEGLNVSPPDARGAGNSDVLVAAAPKKMVGSHLEFLAKARVHPTAVNVDALALYSVAQYLRLEGGIVPENLAILDIGATKTTVCLIHRNRPWVLRTLSWGANALTIALARRYEWSLEEAERRKRVATVQLAEEWIEPLVREARLALRAFESSTQTRIEHCWVSGGGAKLRQFPEYLAHRLNLQLVGKREGFGSTSPRAFAVAFGLALHPKLVGRRWFKTSRPLSMGYDLKHQLQVAQQTRTLHTRRDLMAVGVAGVILAGLGIGDLWSQVTLKEARVKQDRAALTAYSERITGGGTVSSGDEVDQVRRRIDAVQKQLEVLESQQIAPLSSLAMLVKHLPPGVPLKVRNLLMEGRAVQLEAETDSFDSVERVKRALATEESFQDISVGDARVGVTANQVIFRLTLTIGGS
ncbi:hypothetical protein YTPLAS18_19790 [Nitrospira sp.]|nr:hypothetical protein YTPLAS18_19790 [Nitrospira sp.]